MKNKLILFLLSLGLFFGTAPAQTARNIRWDFQATTINTTVGNLLPVYAIPFAQVSFFSCDSSGTVCNTFADVFNSVSSTTPCPANAQVVYNGSSTCIATSDYEGNFGGWFAPGLYKYTITYPGGTYSYFFSPGNYQFPGTGTVTSFASGNLNPLFNSSVTNPNTTPTQAFTLQQTANATFFGNFAGSTGNPDYWTLLAGTNVALTPNVGAKSLTLSTTNGVQVNGATVNSPNFVDTSSVNWTNPTGGQILATAPANFSAYVNLPITGQSVVLFPTVSATMTPGDAGTGTAFAGKASASITNGPGGGVLQNNTWGVNFSTFVLPSDIPAGNVTSIYAFMISTLTNTGAVWFNYGTCTDGLGHTAGLTPSGIFTSGSNWAQRQFTQPLTGVTGSNIGLLSCNAQTQRSSGTGGNTETYNVNSVGIIVYYSGTPSTYNLGTTQIAPPAFYNAALKQLGVDPNASFHGLDLQGIAISALPTSPISSSMAILVNNASTTTDCTVGGGTNYVLCRWNGTNWSSFAGGTIALSNVTAGATGTGTYDFSGATKVRLPVAAGFTSAANGEVGYDSTNKNWHTWVNGVDTLLVPIPTGFVSGHCPQPTNTGGTWIFADAGGACGISGGVVTAFSGDGALYNNVGSVGAVTASLAAASAHQFWGNPTGGSTTPGYFSIGVQDVSPNTYVAGGGSANAQTATYTPAVTSLVAGLNACWLPVAANTTTTPTFAPNGLTATVITKSGTAALAASDLSTTAVACAIYDGAGTPHWQLQNPQSGAGVTAAGGIASISVSTLSVGKVSASAPSSAVIANPTANTINTANAGAANNIIAGGSSNTTGNAQGQTISGGSTNSTTSDYATVTGGNLNQANNTYATAGGKSNVASGSASTAFGNANTASGAQSVALGDTTTASAAGATSIGDHTAVSGANAHAMGTNSTSSGQFSIVLGNTATDRGNIGSFIMSPGGPAATQAFPGRAQWEEHVFFVSCSGSSTTCRLTANGSTATGANVASPGNTSSVLWTAEFVGADNTTADTLTYTFGPSLMTRGANAAATVMSSGNPTATAGPTTTTPPALGVPTITADTTNGGFNVSVVTPSGNAHTWYMVCRIRMLVTQYN